MDAPQLFEQNLALIERTIDRVCRRAHVFDADAEDFASVVKIALIENDYAILRTWEQRSSLATFLAVIVQRFLADDQIRTIGRWHPSAEARRMGETAVLVESLIHRRGRSIDEALPIARGLDPSLTRERVAEIVELLPERVRRPRAVELDDRVAEVLAAPEEADARVLADDAQRLAGRTADVVRATLAGFTDEDQTLIWLRFGSATSIADISRMMRLPQRPLYRRLESLLARLRAALMKAGVDASALEDVIGTPDGNLDFGLGGKDARIGQTVGSEAAREARDRT
jgi:RNA polymerase sigma factor for flagellar operon FliA